MIEKEALAAVSLIAAVACLTLGFYVIRRNRHLRSSRAFFAATIMATLAALSDLLTITSPDAATARLFAGGIILYSILLAVSMLYLALILPFEREGSWAVRHRWAFTTAAVTMGVVMSAGGIEVAEDQYGWWILLNMPSLLWYVSMVLFFLAGTIVLILAYRRERGDEARRRLLPLIAGMAVPVLSGLVVAGLIMNETADPPLLSAIVLSSCLCIGYGVVHQKLFILEPVVEKVVENVQRCSRTPSVRPGSGVLVEAKTGNLAYCMFVNEIAAGGHGLMISRRHPGQLREQYGLVNTPMLWLTTKPGANHIDPASLSLLLHSVLGFLQKSSGAVVLLDGLEYLEAYNKSEAIMQLIYGLRDAITVTDSKLIISVDPAALDPLVLPRLEREMEVVNQTTQAGT